MLSKLALPVFVVLGGVAAYNAMPEYMSARNVPTWWWIALAASVCCMALYVWHENFNDGDDRCGK